MRQRSHPEFTRFTAEVVDDDGFVGFFGWQKGRRALRLGQFMGARRDTGARSHRGRGMQRFVGEDLEYDPGARKKSLRVWSHPQSNARHCRGLADPWVPLVRSERDGVTVWLRGGPGVSVLFPGLGRAEG